MMEFASKNALVDQDRVLAPPSEAARGYRPCTAEVAPCTCPDVCDRDHEND